MQTIVFPSLLEAETLLRRPSGDLAPYREKVAAMLAAIRTEGDRAVQRFALQFDGCAPTWAGDAEFDQAEINLPEALKTAIRQAYANIRRFHQAQAEKMPVVETMPGVRCWRRSVPVERVGLYVPGGTAPLFSTVLMLGVPAQLAGCQEVILCTPPQRDGWIHPAILFAARLCGIRQVYKLGGVQAIGALAYGTESVPRVWKIFGPGNAWVTAAKQLVQLDGLAVDLPAGPSELAVVADAAADPRVVAADLLSQAEHGADSQVLLLTDSAALLDAVAAELPRQLAELPRRDLAAQALGYSKALLLRDLGEALDWVNAYAPEHLILQIAQPHAFAEKVTNAGSVFLGPFTPESAGDYASGTNHTLPTGGHARAYAGVSLDSFVKKITFQEISASGLVLLGPHVEEMARAEGLSAHARAVSIRNTAKAVAAPAVPASEWVLERLRPNIRALKPYASARDEFKAGAKSLAAELVFLDANENSLGSPLPEDLSRYPGPQQGQLKARLAEREQLLPAQIFLGNGSDEAIDLLLRAFCEPGLDNVVLLPPTYGMYAVMANIQGIDIRYAPLRPDFSPDPAAVRAAWDARSKILFLCSPNNPSGNLLPEAFVLEVLREFPGLVVVDEAYGDFSGQASATRHLPAFPNLVVLKTLSKAWGLAGLRLGMAFAQPALIEVLHGIKYPYNLGSHTLRLALAALDEGAAVQKNIEIILAERERLARRLRQHPAVVELYPSMANFLLVKTRDADRLYAQLLENQIVVRNRSQEMHCENCLRITVGSPSENDRLLAILDSIPVEFSQPQA